MAMNGLVGTGLVVAMFFVVGVIVGIISVIAMAALRSDRDRKPPDDFMYDTDTKGTGDTPRPN
jgi:hypothetical protein